jgi:hypothetical protein
VIGIDIDTTDRFADLTKEEEKRFFRTGRKAVRKGVNRLRKRVRSNLRTPGSGRIYVVDGKTHRASRPDEDPAKLTGGLARAMTVSVKAKKREGQIVGSVHPRREHWLQAFGLEFGAIVGNWVLAARGFLRRAMIQEERAIAADLSESVED